MPPVEAKTHPPANTIPPLPCVPRSVSRSVAPCPRSSAVTDPTADRRAITALRVCQWLPDWEEIEWKPEEDRSEPPPHFYQFTISARSLRLLSGVYRRTHDRDSATADLGIQRRHQAGRSREIAQFVRYGYPWSKLRRPQRDSPAFRTLRQPGWLPTAIVVNILTADQRRHSQAVAPEDLLQVQDRPDDPDLATLRLPDSFGADWQCRRIPPLEVIDGQHRLGAFDTEEVPPDFSVPVVAFHGLDLSWQAYLFYTINIKPKRINASLAFDLYPLLRAEDWLDKAEGHRVYREIRAQELTDTLWAHRESPWRHRINMLGEPGHTGLRVSQAAWVRSLTASFIKQWEGPGVRVGGLFGVRLGQDNLVLPWNRAQQAAFLLALGLALRDAVEVCEEEWAEALRKAAADDAGDATGGDAAFVGADNLLNQDQGVRVLLQTLNDLHFVSADDLRLHDLRLVESTDTADADAVSVALTDLRERPWYRDFARPLATALARYDWRSSRADGLTAEQQTLKASFRGSAGYRNFREHLLRHLAAVDDSRVSRAARQVSSRLGYTGTER